MKKYLALLLAGVMMLSLVACGEKQTTDDEQTGNEAGNGSLSSIVDLNTDWLPYDENGNLKLTERDAEGKNGVVTSANYYASKIGEKIIEQGGNAIDAAVAMGFAMSTVESYYSGLGGGGYMLIRFAETGETVFLDFRETAPTGANPELAATIQKIIDEGVDGFYTGSVAQAIVDTCNKYGNTMTLEDLANFEVKVRTPVSGNYRGYTVISSPPSSSGGTSVVEILNMLENYDVASLEVNSPEYINLFTEAFKIAFADRAEYIADTDFTSVPLEGLQSKDFAKARASLIELGTTKDYLAGEPYGFQGSNTTHLSIMDKEGNIVSMTQTNNGGSGYVAEGTGVLLNGEMADFSTGYDNANAIEEGKRPLSSMSPTIILDENGNPFAAVGTPGGTRIITTMAEIISHIIDHGMDIQDAINVPRFFCNGGDLYMETRIPEDVSAALEAMGYTINRTKDYDSYYGGVHGVVRLDDGTLRGGADIRRDGKALAY